MLRLAFHMIRAVLFLLLLLALPQSSAVQAQSCDLDTNSRTSYSRNVYGTGTEKLTLCANRGDTVRIEAPQTFITIKSSVGGSVLSGQTPAPVSHTFAETGTYEIELYYIFSELVPGLAPVCREECGRDPTAGTVCYQVCTEGTAPSYQPVSGRIDMQLHLLDTAPQEVAPTRAVSAPPPARPAAAQESASVSPILLLGVLAVGGAGLFVAYSRKYGVPARAASPMRYLYAAANRVRPADSTERGFSGERTSVEVMTQRLILYRSVALAIPLLLFAIALAGVSKLNCAEFRLSSCVQPKMSDLIFFVLMALILLLWAYLLNRFIVQPVLETQDSLRKVLPRSVMMGGIMGLVLAALLLPFADATTEVGGHFILSALWGLGAGGVLAISARRKGFRGMLLIMLLSVPVWFVGIMTNASRPNISIFLHILNAAVLGFVFAIVVMLLVTPMWLVEHLVRRRQQKADAVIQS